MWNGCNFRVITMRGRGFSFHGPVNSGEAGGHRSKPEVVLAYEWDLIWVTHSNLKSQCHSHSVRLGVSETEISDHQEVHILLYVINDLSEKLHNQPSILMIDCLVLVSSFSCCSKKDRSSQSGDIHVQAKWQWLRWVSSGEQRVEWLACPWACMYRYMLCLPMGLPYTLDLLLRMTESEPMNEVEKVY